MSTYEDRIHACLDGELPRAALSRDELRGLQALEAALTEAAAELRRLPAPDVTAAVMAALPPEGPSGEAVGPRSERRAGFRARASRLLWRPVTLTLRPAYALAGALAVGLLLLVAPGTPGPVEHEPLEAGAGGEDPRLYVQFRIEVPDASQVALAGSFTAWQPEHELIEVSPGVWSTMVALEPGVYDYTFVIDGERMVIDPYAPRVADSFGGSNSRLFLPAPNGRV